MAWREQVFVRWRNRHREGGTDLIGLVCRLLAQHTLHARRSNLLEQSPKHREALQVPVLCSAQEQRLSCPRKKRRLPRSVPWLLRGAHGYLRIAITLGECNRDSPCR